MAGRAGRLGVLVWLTVLFGPVARAETAVAGAAVAPGSRIFEYVVSQPQREAMFAEGHQQDMALHLHSDCTEQQQVHPQRLVVLQTIDLPDDRVSPVSGVWHVRYDLVRCYDTKRYNVIFAADPQGGKPRIVASFPGESLASLRLLRDAMGLTAATANAKAGEARCAKAQQVVLADMRVDQMPHRVVEGDEVFENVWNETWTFDVCGHPVAAAMRFVANPRDGGADWNASFPGASPATAADR